MYSVKIRRMVLFLWIGSVPTCMAWGVQSNPPKRIVNPKGQNFMTPKELVETLRRISPAQRYELDALAKTVDKESRALPHAAASLLNDPNPNVVTNAMSLLIDMQDMAVVPMLAAPEPIAGYDRVSIMTVVVSNQLEVRNKIVERLKRMLMDRRSMNYTRSPLIEAAPPQSRVCDEAYVLLRRLLNTSEDPEKEMMNLRLFLQLPETSRDVEIQKSESLKTWSDFVDEE